MSAALAGESSCWRQWATKKGTGREDIHLLPLTAARSGTPQSLVEERRRVSGDWSVECECRECNMQVAENRREHASRL